MDETRAKQLSEIERITSSNEFWTLGSGDHLNMIDRMLEIAEEQRTYIKQLEAQITYYKCPDCSPTDFEYCKEHFASRTEVWSGGDGY